MKTSIFILIFFLPSLMFGAVQLHKVKEKIGQRYYLKSCQKCHGEGTRGGSLATEAEWREFFKKDAKDLVEFHDENPEVVKYLKSKQFLDKEQLKMKYFLLEFAGDSDNLPSCNN